MNRYQVERLPNGLDLASKLRGCYAADGTYVHGDLHAATLDDLLGVALVEPDNVIQVDAPLLGVLLHGTETTQ